METNITEIHQAIRSGRLTCHSLVQQYLDRIQAYDKRGPALNAMLYVNPNALREVDAMDATYRKTHRMQPLFCAPIVLKDNYDTADMPTTVDSLSMKGAQPAADATAEAKLRQNGALILGKTNLHEFALAGVTASSLGGQTKNPYDLTRTPDGSSGGTGAALAANFAVAGTGSDTANSIRSPSSANNLVGIRGTRGLVSTAGIIPVAFTQDAVGLLARNVSDAARMLDAMAGYDPKDPATAFNVGHIPKTYTAFLNKHALRGARIGVPTTLFGKGLDYQQVNDVMAKAIAEPRRQGATIVMMADPEMDTSMLNNDLDVQKYEYKHQINAYLKDQGDRVPIHSLAEIVSPGQYHKPSLDKFLKTAQSIDHGLSQPDYWARRVKIDALKERVAQMMAANHLDALVYPHQKRLPVLIGDMNQADRNGILGALTGNPAITVPAGFSTPIANAPIGVPVGIEFLGQPWNETKLISLAYSFEQATYARKPPVSTPSLRRQ